MKWYGGCGALVALGLVACGSTSAGSGQGADTLGDGGGSGSGASSGSGSGASSGSGSGASSGASSGAGTISGCGPNSAAPNSIAGTWDVQGSISGDRPTMATLILDDSHFIFSASGGDQLKYVSEGGTPATTWLPVGSDSTDIRTTHTSAALNQGIFPLALGGVWSFSGYDGSDEACQAQIGAPLFTASCIDAYDIPPPFPSNINGNISGTRMSTLPSIFGDLGGVWHIGSPGSTAGGCQATMSGNTLSVTCVDSGEWDGMATLTFCDGIAVGSTSEGVEFTAVRE